VAARLRGKETWMHFDMAERLLYSVVL